MKAMHELLRDLRDALKKKEEDGYDDVIEDAERSLDIVEEEPFTEKEYNRIIDILRYKDAVKLYRSGIYIMTAKVFTRRRMDGSMLGRVEVLPRDEADVMEAVIIPYPSVEELRDYLDKHSVQIEKGVVENFWMSTYANMSILAKYEDEWTALVEAAYNHLAPEDPDLREQNALDFMLKLDGGNL